MTSGLDPTNPALVAAFRAALMWQSGVVAAIIVLLLLARWAARRWRAVAAPQPPPRDPVPATEPAARRFLRVAFGALWVFDGILQAQPKMAGGLTSLVIAPTAASSPRWVQHLVDAGGTIWSFHPVQAGAAAVWIQAGLGLWLLTAETGWWSRLAGLASVAWGLVVWVQGESFGGVFAPGLSWMSGAPGAVVIYVVAGALIALPPLAWARPELGRILLAGIGVFWVGMAALQAWPGRGYWQGRNGTLTAMVRSMAQAPQPHAQAAMVSTFASFISAHGLAVNLFTVIALTVTGLAFVSGRQPLLRVAVPAAIVGCLADWVLVQDFGFIGGLGTDPNSMPPWALLVWSGYLAMARAPDAAARDVVPPPRPRLSPELVRAALRPAALRHAMASASVRSVTSLGAIGIVLVGVAPMAAASAQPRADLIIARAIAGAPTQVDLPAPGFRLVSQSGRTVSMASLRGRVTLLTFLDPVSCSDCAVIAEELNVADTMLGALGRQVDLVAIAATATHSGTAFIRAFDQHADMAKVPNWLFLTGTLGQLQQVWTRYEKVAPHMMAGMMAHSNITFVIDKTGQIRMEIRDNPGPATASTRSSFEELLSSVARQTLALR